MQQHPLSSSAPVEEWRALQRMGGVTHNDHHFHQGTFGMVELPAAYRLTWCLPVALFSALIEMFCSEEMKPLHHHMLTTVKTGLLALAQYKLKMPNLPDISLFIVFKPISGT